MPAKDQTAMHKLGRGGKAWRQIRAQVLYASGGICWLCGKPGADTVDHVIPLIDGGDPLDPQNLKAAHGKRQPWGCPGNYGRGKRMSAPPITREW